MSSTAFSYAQAAKGQTIPQPSPQLTSSSAPPSVKDDVPTGNTSVSAPSVASNDADGRDTGKPAKTDAETTLPSQDLDLSSLAGSALSTVSAAEHDGKDRREKESTGAESQNYVEDRGSRSASRTSRVNDGPDSRKARKPRKPREKDAQYDAAQEDEKREEAPKPVLSEAPLPTVNFWAKRIEAQQAAKAKPAPSSVVNFAASSAAGQDLKQPPDSTGTQVASTNGPSDDKAQKKLADSAQGADQAPRRSAPRGSRANEKDEKAFITLPPVADTTFWPDPKAAATSEDVSRKPQEKLDGGEKEGQEETSAPKKKSWVNLEITPSVVFNTPLPQRGGKPRTAARGGRDTVSARPSHSNAPNASSLSSAGDRPPAINGAAGPKTATSQHRESSNTSRANSHLPPAIPHPTKRASVDVAHKEQRKATPAVAEQSRDSGPDASAASSALGKRASAVRDIRTDIGAANFEPGNALPRTNTQERGNHVHQKGSEFSKEAGHNNPHGQQFTQREGRADRGRSGGYRGRGGHANGAGPHLPAPFPNGQYATHVPYAARNSAAPSPPLYSGQFQMPFPQQHRGRTNKWGSGQGSARNGANGTSYTSKPAHGNDIPMTPFPPYIYQTPPLDRLLVIIKRQVEYYLSVDNLCKDLWLRQHMDSKGFVRFSTIAGFKRMQELVQDLDLIRDAVSMSDMLDYVMGDDGIERLRLRGDWAKFVLPVNERDEVARNDGPATFHPAARHNMPIASYGGPVVHPGYPAAHPAGFFPTFVEDQMTPYGNGPHYEHTTNGVDANGHRYNHGHETQLSAVVPEFSPPVSSLTLESMTNFTDDQVENLMVVLDSNKKELSGAADCDAAHEGQNGVDDKLGTCNSINGHETNGSANGEHSSSPKPTGRPYKEIRLQALEKREAAQPGETPTLMRNLYHFWGQMLVKDFNSTLYTEFRALAMDDAQKPVPAPDGLKSLIDFYEKLLFEADSPRPWPQGRAIPSVFALHYQEARDLDRLIRAKIDASI